MSVTVAVVAYRNPDDIIGLLASLAQQSDQDMVIHICENGGPTAFSTMAAAMTSALGQGAVDDGALHGALRSVTLRMANGAPVHLHLAASNLGYAGGINLCLRHAAAQEWQALWVVNPDARPEADALRLMRERLRERDCGIVGARLVFAEGGKVQSYGGKWRKGIARGLNLGFGQDASVKPDAMVLEGLMDYVSGACMLVSRAFVDVVGPMREDYFLYCEEVDWCLRRGAFKLGFAADAIVWHGHGSTIGSNSNRRKRSRLAVYLDERNRLLLTRNIYPQGFPVTALVTFALLSQYLVDGAAENFRHALSGWWAGMRGETGPPTWFER
jgi:N-acetylglucosaminyl-diphospho-decaprenol L-rhamnosyltransferase